MDSQPLVPANFPIPEPPRHELFRLDPLRPEHNAADLEAWTTSIDHIHATRGSSTHGWPERAYTLAENLHDLQIHRAHHLQRLDFAGTVPDPAHPDVVIGCVYLAPDSTAATSPSSGTRPTWT